MQTPTMIHSRSHKTTTTKSPSHQPIPITPPPTFVVGVYPKGLLYMREVYNSIYPPNQNIRKSHYPNLNILFHVMIL